MDEKTAENRIIGGRKDKTKNLKPSHSTKGNLITAENALGFSGGTRVIGGDTDDPSQQSPPVIVIEKDGDRISRIMVKCPCGRHSQLRCEYDD